MTKSDGAKKLPLHHLHHQAAHGFPISDEDRVRLEGWYARQNDREATILNPNGALDFADLRREIEAALAEAQRIELRCLSLIVENAALRQQNERLGQGLETGRIRRGAHESDYVALDHLPVTLPE